MLTYTDEEVPYHEDEEDDTTDEEEDDEDDDDDDDDVDGENQNGGELGVDEDVSETATLTGCCADENIPLSR